MSAGHVRTAALVVRSGPQTSLVAVPAWRSGRILAAVDTMVLLDLTGLPRRRLPGTRLSVAARLDAVLDADLDLRAWTYDSATPRHTAA